MGNQENYADEEIVTLTLDNNEEVECSVVGIFEAEGKEYIALLPLTEVEGSEEGDVFIYRYKETEDGQPILENIEDDAEFDVAADAFDELMDSMEFEELEEEQ